MKLVIHMSLKKNHSNHFFIVQTESYEVKNVKTNKQIYWLVRSFVSVLMFLHALLYIPHISNSNAVNTDRHISIGLKCVTHYFFSVFIFLNIYFCLTLTVVSRTSHVAHKVNGAIIRPIHTRIAHTVHSSTKIGIRERFLHRFAHIFRLCASMFSYLNVTNFGTGVFILCECGMKVSCVFKHINVATLNISITSISVTETKQINSFSEKVKIKIFWFWY